jgi:hypothetical protein
VTAVAANERFDEKRAPGRTLVIVVIARNPLPAARACSQYKKRYWQNY